MRVTIEFNNKRVDIKEPIRKIDGDPETAESLRQALLESLVAHGFKASIQLVEAKK